MLLSRNTLTSIQFKALYKVSSRPLHCGSHSAKCREEKAAMSRAANLPRPVGLRDERWKSNLNYRSITSESTHCCPLILDISSDPAVGERDTSMGRLTNIHLPVKKTPGDVCRGESLIWKQLNYLRR